MTFLSQEKPSKIWSSLPELIRAELKLAPNICAVFLWTLYLFYFIQSVSLTVTAGVTTCKDDISIFFKRQRQIFFFAGWINILPYLKLFIDGDATIKACLNFVGYMI